MAIISVEAQKDFHIKRLTELGLFTTTTHIPPITPPMQQHRHSTMVNKKNLYAFYVNF